MDQKKTFDDLIKIQDDGTAFFTINQPGKGTGDNYFGKFHVHCMLTANQILSAGKSYRTLLGQNMAFADSTEINLAFAISQLEQRIIKAPSFWNGGNLKDLDIIMLVLDMAVAAEEKYREIQKEEAAQALDILRKNYEEYVSSSKPSASRKKASTLGNGEDGEDQEDFELDEEESQIDE